MRLKTERDALTPDQRAHLAVVVDQDVLGDEAAVGEPARDGTPTPEVPAPPAQAQETTYLKASYQGGFLPRGTAVYNALVGRSRAGPCVARLQAS